VTLRTCYGALQIVVLLLLLMFLVAPACPYQTVTSFRSTHITSPYVCFTDAYYHSNHKTFHILKLFLQCTDTVLSPLVLWCCWLGDGKGYVLVCWGWLFDCSFAVLYTTCHHHHLHNPCLQQNQNGGIPVPPNPRPHGKMAVKTERDNVLTQRSSILWITSCLPAV